jgi:hypothetical protein
VVDGVDNARVMRDLQVSAWGKNPGKDHNFFLFFFSWPAVSLSVFHPSGSSQIPGIFTGYTGSADWAIQRPPYTWLQRVSDGEEKFS